MSRLEIRLDEVRAIVQQWERTANRLSQTTQQLAALGPLGKGAKKIVKFSADKLMGKADEVIEGTGNLKPKGLLDELANSGVKYNPNDVVAVTRNADGKLVWLENGNSQAGLNHILNHADDLPPKELVEVNYLNL